MSVSSLPAATSSTQTTQQTIRKDTLSQQDFLNLFVTQMQYQNPLEPLDNAQMATQMAQFSSLEALNTMSETLSNLTSYQYNLNALQSAGLIGKKVEVTGSNLSISDGSISEGFYQLANSGKVTLQVLDGQGNVVRTMDKGWQDTSKQKVAWDGKNDGGTKMPDGTYSFVVSARDSSGSSVSVNSSMLDKVTEVSFDQGVIYLSLGSKVVKMSELISVSN